METATPGLPDLKRQFPLAMNSASAALPLFRQTKGNGVGQKLLILDVGSSALKAVLFDRSGAVAASAAEPLATRTGVDHSVEQDADDWWLAVRAAVAKLPSRDEIEAIALTGSMQNVIALSSEGKPLGPAVLYSDRRLEADSIESLRQQLPQDYATRTGNHLDPAHCILKLMRFERFYPGHKLGNVGTFLFGAKDAVIHRLTGKAVIDPTTATTTGLYNIATGDWDGELLAATAVRIEQLPRILPAQRCVGSVLDGPAQQLGLRAGTLVVNGAGDGAAATWGAFADQPNAAYAYLGTTGWVAATMALEHAKPPRDSYTLADPVHPDRAIVISPLLNAGSALDWLAEMTSLPVEKLLEQAGNEGPAPLFLPYLLGERSPFEDQSVRGAFLGLDRNHGPGALCRSVLEGIAFAVRHNLEAANLPPTPLTVIGGGARSLLQLHYLADVLGRPMTAPAASQDMPALGIYRMLAKMIDFAPIEAFQGSVVVQPRAEHVARSDQRFKTYLSASQFARDIAKNLA